MILSLIIGLPERLYIFFLSRDELLPLVHLSWQPLKLLFTSENLFIVEKAFSVVRVFAECAGEFIHKRALTDVFPAIMAYIKRLQVICTASVQKKNRY